MSAFIAPPTYPKMRRNLLAFGSDTILFAIAYSGFLNPTIVIPAFLSMIGASTTTVGLVLALVNLAWSLPQFVGGNILGRFPKKKTPVLIAEVGRIFIPAFVILLSVTGGNPPGLMAVALCVAMMIFLSGDGFATIGWLDMLTRAFPAEKRGSYISIWQAISSIGILGASALVSLILAEGGPPFPKNYVILFGFSSVMFVLSSFGTLSIHEPPHPEIAPGTAHVPWRDLAAHLIAIWRSDSRLRKLASARVVFSFAMMAFPFFTLFATDVLRLPTEVLGQFIGAQTIGTMIGGLALGRVADRHGPHRAIQIGALIMLTTPILGLVMSTRTWWMTSWLNWIYIWIYICTGLVNNLLFLGFGNYLMDISPSGQRTIYIGAVNAINSIGVIAPLVAGLLLSFSSYTVLFIVTLAFCLMALVMVFRLPHSRENVMMTSVLDRAQR